MQRTTLAEAKASRIPEAMNIGPTDSRFVTLLNEGVERLLHRGKFWGTYGRFAIEATEKYVTLPPRIDTVEAITVADYPLPLRSDSFPFLANGWGARDTTLSTGSGIDEALYRGLYPTTKDLSADSIVTLKCDLVEDVGKEVTIYGLDANGNHVRTDPGGTGDYQDGETIALAQGAGTASSTTWSEISNIQAPADLEGSWWLYEGTVAAGTLIGTYEHWDTRPAWKRYMIPWVNSTVSTIEIMGKLAFIPVANDADYLVIGNLTALKYACMAILADERHDFAIGAALMELAVKELNHELDHHVGAFQRGVTITGPGYGFGDTMETYV